MVGKKGVFLVIIEEAHEDRQHFPSVAAVARSSCFPGGISAEHSKIPLVLTVGGARMELLLITSWQFLYLLAKSEKIKQTRTIFHQKSIPSSLPMSPMHKGVAIKST